MTLGTPTIIACQTLLSMGFPGKDAGKGFHFLLWGIFPELGIELMSSALAGGFFTTEPGRKARIDSESEVTQSCLTLCDPVDCSLPGSSIHGILQARVLEWVTISLSRGSSQPRDWTWVSRIGGRSFNLWATREYTVAEY